MSLVLTAYRIGVARHFQIHRRRIITGEFCRFGNFVAMSSRPRSIVIGATLVRG